MTSKELHINTILPLRKQLSEAEAEYARLYRKECAENNGLENAHCGNCAYSCVLDITDHNECLGGKCTCCHCFCYGWMPENKVSAWLRENHHYDRIIYQQGKDVCYYWT